ncbi:MAG: serine hydrolase [Porphyrobacter sp.]|nr:serine hydrolase [Porphyrobacter sp.]
MIRRFLAAALLLAPLPAIAEDTPPPATVVVGFDAKTITPLIVEGVANKDTGRPVEANDPVRIASISKLIMGFVAMRLFDEGKIELERDVLDYLGWKLRSPYHPKAKVTLVDLLSHRAGLSDAGDYVIPLGASLEAKMAERSSWRDTGPPGKAAFEYANLGSPVVATVLEAASGERYDRLVERLVFKPLGITACLNWIGCGLDLEARAVTLYRHTGEIAADGPAGLPPACTIPVAEGQACSLDAYVPGTNASIFSPQGGVRIGMVDLAKIGQALLRGPDSGLLGENAFTIYAVSALSGETGSAELFCHYGLALQAIQIPGTPGCDDDLFGSGGPYVGHPGEAYGLLSGLWFDVSRMRGFVYVTTANPPPPGGEDTGNFTPREKALMARAVELADK